MDPNTVLREQFQHARRSLFIARLLASLESRRDEESSVATLIKGNESANGYTSSVPLVNQSVFLQMAYVTLVWLHEAFARAGRTDELHNKVDFDFSQVKISDAGGNMEPGGPKHPQGSSKLWPLRHAIAHAAVEVDAKKFRFTNRDPKKPYNFVVLDVDWLVLGELCDAVLMAANRVLYAEGQE